MNALDRNEIFNFEGRNITFKVGDVIMVNATEMAKGFRKRTRDWLQTKQAVDITDCVSVKTGIPASTLIAVNHGGINQGTWMHEDVALVFAQWLSPKFYIWCNEKIKELLTTGKTQLKQEETDDLIFEKAVLIAQKRIEEQKIRIAALEVENKELRPDAEYTKEVLKSENTYTMTQIAKEFGYTCQSFAEKLIKCDIIYKQSGQYMLTAKYCDKGYAQNRTHPFVTNSGTQMTKTYMVWTEKGRKFLHDFRESYKEKKKKLEEKGGF